MKSNVVLITSSSISQDLNKVGYALVQVVLVTVGEMAFILNSYRAKRREVSYGVDQKPHKSKPLEPGCS
jgi:hypothetical protein